MRRNEFEIHNAEGIDEVLYNTNHCVLGLITEDNRPYTVPVNYIYYEGRIFFHGALTGKKIKCINSNSYISVSIVHELSLIPSYFSDPKIACPATQFFLSVHCEGIANIEDDLDRKAEILNQLMLKYQPEGKHDSIDAKNSNYLKNLKGVSLISIHIHEKRGKFKLGQHLSKEGFESIVNQLEEREQPLDKVTIKLMKQYYPDKG